MRAAGMVAGAATAGLAATASTAQPVNFIGEPMAEIFIENGCEMKESDAAEALKAKGWFISDFQAQVMALLRGGYLVAGASEGQLKLINWEPCT